MDVTALILTFDVSSRRPINFHKLKNAPRFLMALEFFCSDYGEGVKIHFKFFGKVLLLHFE